MILNKLQHFDASKYNNQAVRLTAAGERSLINGHPWIFSNSILKIKPTAKTGDLCVIFNKSGKKILGVGLFDENSPYIHSFFIFYPLQSNYVPNGSSCPSE